MSAVSVVYSVVAGDCREMLREVPDASVHAVVCDPPYGLSDDPDILNVFNLWASGREYVHRDKGVLDSAWDSFVPGPSVWRQVFRVLRPGGHLIAFSGPRTYDLMALGIRLAGFVIRDQLQWWYAEGYPKGRDIAKELDRAEGAERVPLLEEVPPSLLEPDGALREVVRESGIGRSTDQAAHRFRRGEAGRVRPYTVTQAVSDTARRWEGWHTRLKPACEPMVLAQRPHTGATMAENVREHGVGALNIGGCMIGGRWPSNVLLGHAEGCGSMCVPGCPVGELERQGGSPLFFFCAKPEVGERDAGVAGMNDHPSVKPLALMRQLVRLVTPPGGLVCDPFCGSGTTGVAAVVEGFDFLGMEVEERWVKVSRDRIEAATSQLTLM